MTAKTHRSEFTFGDRVSIDGDQSIKAAVVQVAFARGRTLYELSWIANGTAQSGWVDEFRLSEAVE